MEREPTIDELLNVIKMMKETLDFYSNETNYDNIILKDRGFLAKSILERIENIDKYQQSMIDSFNEAMKEVEGGDEVDTDALDKLNAVNKLLKDFENKNIDGD